MLKKLGLVNLHVALKKKIERNTGLQAFDYVPENAPAPFYSIEIVDKRAENTKTMWCETFTVWIHAIAEEQHSRLGIYNLIESLEEALTEEIVLPEHVTLLNQNNVGVQSLQKDETNEMHAVLAYEFKVCYGFRVKN